MKEITIDKNLVSCCWLYCGACDKFLNDKCSGCKNLDETPFWCTIRDCCLTKGYENCADCKDHPNVMACKKYNGFVMRTLVYLCGSDRLLATNMIKEKGIEGFAKHMAENKIQRIARRKKGFID
jgi:hypothetical protein